MQYVMIYSLDIHVCNTFNILCCRKNLIRIVLMFIQLILSVYKKSRPSNPDLF
jgi:hypothetical protein